MSTRSTDQTVSTASATAEGLLRAFPHRTPPPPLEPAAERPVPRGKLLRLAGDAWFVRGVSYGTFAPGPDGQYPAREQVRVDFAMMARSGINTVRVYTPPPEWLLDEAAEAGLRVMVGIAWAQHVAFLDERAICRDIRQTVRTHVSRLADHPATLLFALGSEVPAGIVRWHGRARLERFLRDLYEVAKAAAPDCVTTYVNFPPTEYLELPWFDVASFNVYLHREPELRAYLARLHNLAGNRPLLLAEVGADSLREGEAGQATLTAMQLRAALDEGACGAVAYAWTDEWWRGGQEVTDWAFGLVDRERQPKLGLHAAATAFSAETGVRTRRAWPSVSVIVCAYNAADTLEECLASLERLDYPHLELILVDDGSTDETGAIAAKHPRVRVIRVPNGGLSAARNIGLAAATGDVVAYTDADVSVDPEWLRYLVEPLIDEGVAGAGGPNVVPPDDPWLAQCVARAPGGPSHVLLDDKVAEHVPGCNMAFRREALLALEGFNPVFTKAGDDVDLCWRLQSRGWRIGFAPCALVWHHHRSSTRAYWRQQLGYGEGEVWLRPLHPERFVGRHALWHGHIYSPLPFVRSLRHAKINAGVWGTAAFPSVYRVDAHPFAHLPHSIRWQLTAAVLLVGGVLMQWTTYATAGQAALVAGGVALAITCGKCVRYARDTELHGLPRIGALGERASQLVYRATVAWLHFIQPIARTHGRIRGYLAPPRRRQMPPPQATPAALGRGFRLLAGRSAHQRFWSERWVGADALLRKITDQLRLSRAVDVIEIDDGWQLQRDFSVSAGRWGWLDVRALVEEHAGGRCLVRLATSARLSRPARAAIGLGLALALVVGTGSQWVGGTVGLTAAGALLTLPMLAAASAVLRTFGVVQQAVTKVTADTGLTSLHPTDSEADRPGA